MSTQISTSRKHTYISLTPYTLLLYSLLGFTGVYIIFLISVQNNRLWVLVEAVLMIPTIYVWSRNMKKYQNFYLKTFNFGGDIFNIFE